MSWTVLALSAAMASAGSRPLSGIAEAGKTAEPRPERPMPAAISNFKFVFMAFSTI
jgi:hypothetical protein